MQSKGVAMDYRNYDKGRPLLPPIIRRNARYLRPLGILFFIIGITVPFLILIKIIPSLFFINFLAYTSLVLAPISYLVGLAFDGTIDRSN
jgi:hypothetical protein